METLIRKLLPLTDRGLLLRVEGSTLYASGLRPDVDLEALAQELREGWLELAREEALLRVRVGAEARAQALRPSDFADLMARLQLGRIRPEEQARLNAYYDALDALEGERAALETAIAEAATVAELNAIAWPEWVAWKPTPENPELVLEAAPQPEAPGEPEGGA